MAKIEVGKLAVLSRTDDALVYSVIAHSKGVTQLAHIDSRTGDVMEKWADNNRVMEPNAKQLAAPHNGNMIVDMDKMLKKEIYGEN